MRPVVVLAVFGLSASSFACGGGTDACVTLDLSCAPLYAPTFENVHSRTLALTCAQAGGACHAPQGAQGGLVLSDPDAAYQALTGGSNPRVIAGDAACSLVVSRLEASEPTRVMPPGRALSLEERCAIEQWIEMGAAR